MLATVTLASTSFAAAVSPSDTQVLLSSTSGIVPGVRLFANGELFTVDRLTGIGNYAAVRRGRDGTATTPHAASETVYIGRGDQFYEQDPVGVAPLPPVVLPYINVRNGQVWWVQGDEDGPGTAARTWVAQTTSQSAGVFGVRVNTTTVPS